MTRAYHSPSRGPDHPSRSGYSGAAVCPAPYWNEGEIPFQRGCEKLRCSLCHASTFRLVYQRDRWRYLRCLNCGLVFLHPKPARDVLIKNYENYLPADPEEISQWERMMRPVVVLSAQLIEGQSEPGRGRLLDIGSGYGFFLQEMKRRGWQVEGIEVSRAGRRYAQDKWGIHVYSKPLEDIGFPRNAFDVITLFYVVEHVHDPLALLREVNRVLKPGGLVLLRWPHSTPIVRVLGPLSRKLDLYHTPYHLYDFSPRTMKRLLNLSGFEDIQTRVGGHTLPHEAPARWCSVLFSLLGEALSFLTLGHVLLPGISKTTTAFSTSSPHSARS